MSRIMRTRFDRPGGFASLAVLFLLALLAACADKEVKPPDGEQVVLARTVCPQHGSVWVPGEQDTAWRLLPELSVPGPNTQIPEFHDCQRLLDKDKDGYTAEAAIYAFPGIVDLPEQLRALEQAGDPLRAIAGAEIISTADYDKLGIKLGANCLYLFTQQGNLRAFMRPVATETDCAQRLNPVPPQPGWKQLIVTQDPEQAPFTRFDFSPSARWDYDARPAQRLQFIGLPCEQAYCMIAGAAAQSWKRYDRPGQGVKGRRVVKLRTWYDEQILGILPASGGVVVPSGVFGTIFPDSVLGERGESDYQVPDQPWLHAADIRLQSALPYYKTKFNLDVTPDGEYYNQVSLCMGPDTRCIPQGVTPPTCGTTNDPWYARIVSLTGDVKYNCVKRHLHQGFSIPGNARWYWLPNDEGIWVRCPNGCCQVT